ncbi:uncharacterized protein N0V89_008999 [Didymosphaeria variabile]|uniref:Uncharacterized protein n=1 Tax=Didymosphaeria variabile TaxID=1932322 RepID=A0A9W9C9C6_9PLEO|nr:uncharacterized protein N0V89_008999 [Didymosphaeria variabile]KAJ4350378.1 hypothetical protein N0V89_008999 [Didymosphaeria variabile]
MVVILDESEMDEEARVEVPSSDKETRRGKLVACAGVVPWKGGWQSEDPGDEVGWEVKTVCVDEGEKYRRKGLAMGLLKTLEELIVGREREKIQVARNNGRAN